MISSHGRTTATLVCLLFESLCGDMARAQAADVREIIFENGLKIILLEDHKSPLITFQVWYRVGSRNEKDGKSGLSHFLEHMSGPKDYSRIIAKNGGHSNAFTTADHTVYFATLREDKIDIAIEMEASRMASVLLDGAEFESEKKVVMEERRLSTEDQPVSALAELTNATAYIVHPYRRPVVGWMEDIENLSREDLAEHYRTYYVPNNAFVVVVGDFSSGEMIDKVRSAFGKIRRRPEPPKSISKEPQQSGERRVVLHKDAELPFLLSSYPVPNSKDKDGFALDLLTVILAGGRSSRLYKELVYDKRLARGVDASYYGLSVDPTLFSITAQVMPGRDPMEVERSIDAILDGIKTERVGHRELEKAKNQVEAAFVFGQDGIFEQATRIGLFESAAGWRLLGGYLNGIRDVSTADLLKIAKKYLDVRQRTVGTLIPSRDEKP